MVPEEHSLRAPKLLIFPANRQWKITETINSTIISIGKGRTFVDKVVALPPHALPIEDREKRKRQRSRNLPGSYFETL